MAEELLPLDEALARLRAALPGVPTPALNADRDDPAVDRSAMDGIALRAEDGMAPRRLVGTLFAGEDPARFRVGPGEAIRIMTGAAVPEGADAVVPVERLEVMGQKVSLSTPPGPGDHIRKRGTQARAGDLLQTAGAPLTAATVGLRAQLGFPFEPLRRVVVGIAATGDELQPDPLPYQIRDSNSPMLTALAHRLGGDARRLPSLPDDEAALRARLADLGDHQVLLTSGGVSMGQKDFLPSVLEQLGARILVHKIRLKPGKPMLVALLGERVILGLPGNPLAAYLNAMLFLPLALARLSGFPEPDLWRQGELAEPLKNGPDRPLLHPCSRSGDRLTPLPSKGSGDLITLARSQACAWIPEGGHPGGAVRYLEVL
jgi:molybdopterin molybdotransferase